MNLIKYRDAESTDYLYFWVNSEQRQISPEFYSQEEAESYLQQFEYFRPARDIQ